MRSLATGAVLPFLAYAAPVSAQIVPASAADVWDGVQSCEAITETDRVQTTRLSAAGWSEAKRRSGERGTRKLAGIYEKDGNDALIVIGREELEGKRCVVLARLESTSAYGELVKGVAELAGMPDRQEEYAYIWDRPGFTLRVEPSGKQSEPNALFTVTAIGDSASTDAPVPSPASVATPAGSSDAVLAALKACLPAVGANGFDGSVLTGSGWSKSVAQTASGADIDLYESEGSDVLITPGSGDQGGDVCLVRGQVDDGATLDNIRAALTGLYGTPEADGGDLYWIEDGSVFYLMTNFEPGGEGPFAVQIPVSYAGESE
ncbi:hypothetical protein [Pseudoblastomonas halimionae]|uniref:DUF4892 domain-containing protein n=1 Tax=Alteriqipengyuania halimionae TaxID=1926630 RepID=A0A6I4U1R8_9SPHN|nr:hypothetical protein [Alteriqipengyuania halimionae]MXP09848.1 hypothetical protein [Alteriqipengyuania halimionae]